MTIAAAADALFEARRSLKPIPPIRERFGLAGLADAYAVQAANTARLLASGQRLTGRKIGLTSPAVQRQMGVDQPDFGALWADLAFADGDAIPMRHFMQPKLEGEIAFVLGRDVPGTEPGMSDLIAAIDYVVPAFEIVDSAIADWDIRLMDTVADNASAAGYVLGTAPRRLEGVDLRLCGMVLSRNGAEVSTGVGAACMEHPLTASLWLARKMASLGEPLAAGQVVLSGALGPMVPVQAGDHFQLEIAGFAPVRVGFTA